MTLEENYVRGTVALIQSILTNAACPDSVFLHLMTHDKSNSNDDDDVGSGTGARGALSTLTSLFPDVRRATHEMSRFNITSGRVVRADMRYRGGDLEAPLNYARAWLPHALPRCVARVAVIDTDVIVLDRIESLFRVDMGPDHPPGVGGAVFVKQNRDRTAAGMFGGLFGAGSGQGGAAVAAAEWCQHRVEEYFTDHFWKSDMSKSVGGVRNACYFNPGVMVVDTARWRANGHTQQLESWMRAQASAPVGQRLYRLGSLPPFLLVFAGHLARPGLLDNPSWNIHDLGCGCGTRVEPATVKAMHWSCGGKPWRRLDAEATYVSARRAEVMNVGDQANGDLDGSTTKTKPPPLSMRPCAVDRYFWKPYDVLGMSSSSAAAARRPRRGPTFLPGDTVGGFGGGPGATLWGGIRDAGSEQREREEEEEQERKAFEWEEKTDEEEEKEKKDEDEEEDEEEKEEKKEEEEDDQPTDAEERSQRERGGGVPLSTTAMDLFAAAEEAEEESEGNIDVDVDDVGNRR